MESLGGGVTIDTEIGKGITFMIWLPRSVHVTQLNTQLAGRPVEPAVHSAIGLSLNSQPLGKSIMHEIRLAYETDGEAIRQFIDQHWRKDHVLSTSEELLDWQHLDRKRRRYNFVVGVERETQALHGLLGFIPLSQFDPEIEFGRLCWMAIWKTHDAARGHGLGRRILTYLEDTVKPDIISTIGASAMTLPMYEAKGYQTGMMAQYFILNPEITNFRLATTKGSGQPLASAVTHTADKMLEPASESDIISGAMDCFLVQKDPPRKSPAYLVNRYFRHPIYRYQSYRIQQGTLTTGVIVTRVCRHEESRAIRIVDFIGPSGALCGLQDQWKQLLKNVNAEYIDFYCAGIDEEDLLASGFIRRETDGDTIIPNYFEPFSKETVEINYTTSAPKTETYRMVKGDSDQDRPNLLEIASHE